MKKITAPGHLDVSRRERQILDVLFARGRSTAAEVQAALPDAPSYSAVRALLRILETKGFIHHQQDGPRYVYVTAMPRDTAQRSVLPDVTHTPVPRGRRATVPQCRARTCHQQVKRHARSCRGAAAREVRPGAAAPESPAASWDEWPRRPSSSERRGGHIESPRAANARSTRVGPRRGPRRPGQ